MTRAKGGWNTLLDGFPWFSGEGSFPLAAYSEFMPWPRLGRAPYGATDPVSRDPKDPYGWQVPEIEEERELRPGLEHLAGLVTNTLSALCRGGPAHQLSGHGGENLADNPCWPPDLAQAGIPSHERFVLLMPLDLSKTQDDLGRVRWTLFGTSADGPERGFWEGFYTEPDRELPERESRAFLCDLLRQAYGESLRDPDQLPATGLRILPTPEYPANALPSWARRCALDEGGSLEPVRYLLTFRPFQHLPDPVRERYLAGRLHLLPCPQSLVFWGMPTYRRLAAELPLALQIPLLLVASRRGGPDGLRVPQAGWLHELHPSIDPSTVQRELILNTYARTHRWNRVHRYDDELALNPRVDRVSKVLFSTSPQALGLYDKPLARNCQLWARDFHRLLDGPSATPQDLRAAEAALIEGGLFGYRFLFPAMRVGRHEVFWERPLVAFTPRDGSPRVLCGPPCGSLVARPIGAANRGASPAIDASRVDLWPRLLRRPAYLSALHGFDPVRDHYRLQTPLNILSLLDARSWAGKPLTRSLARSLVRIPRQETLEAWLESLPGRAVDPGAARAAQEELASIFATVDPGLPPPVTYPWTAARAFEESWWNDILTLSHGRYVNKDNADCVMDPETQRSLRHHRRDLDELGDYLLQRHGQAIAEAGMEGRAVCGDLPFSWRTDFDFPTYGGWRLNQAREGHERDLLVVIPGRDRAQAVVMADHYDTAYMEDRYEPSRGGSGARLAAAGADDNHSATATLLQAAPLFLRLSREGRLERDVWLLHLTGEEFPADCLGARQFSRMLIEGTLKLRRGEGSAQDLFGTRVSGLLVMDMIAHNRDDARDVFQISPGRNPESVRLAEEAHRAAALWNQGAIEWNQRPERMGKGRGRRSPDGVSVPVIAEHPNLHAEVRTADDPHSSLYNTDGQIFSDVGVPVILVMENYDIHRSGYHDTHDTMENIDLDYGSGVAAIAIETVARLAIRR